MTDTNQASEVLQGDCLLMEKEPEYVEIIKKRLRLNKERLAKLEAEL